MDDSRLQEPLSSRGRLVRFGAFELFLETGELRKHGVRVRLQGKPFQILSALLEEAGRVVTREELRARLWPADMFVDFESGLNTAANRLRIALGDSAEHPVYIETLSRIGYRFIAPVTNSWQPHQPAIKSVVQEVPVVVLAGDKVPEPFKQPIQRVTKSNAFRGWAIAAGLAVIALAAAASLVAVLRQEHTQPAFHQVTFRKGFVESARFTPDGGNIVYSAQWNGAPSRVYLANTVSPEARDLGFDRALLTGLSPTTEMAVLLRPSKSSKRLLESAPLHGGAPRVISDRAMGADWGPDGSLWLVTETNSTYALEHPPGKQIYISSGRISNLRVSPAGDRVAFLEHLIPNDDSGQVVVADTSGKAKLLSANWGSALGIAWNPSGREVWFTAARSGVDRELMAVDLYGRTRQVAQVPGNLELQDIAPSGKVLIARTLERMTMVSGSVNGGTEKDISWLDWSRAAAETADGMEVLFDESGEGGGPKYSTYLYRADGRSSERLGEGRAMDLSADGKWALTEAADDLKNLTLISVDTPVRKPVSGHGMQYRWTKFFPSGPEILFSGSYPKQPAGLFRQNLPDGVPVLVKEGLQIDSAVIDNNARFAAGVVDDAKVAIVDLANGDTRMVPVKTWAFPVAFITDKLLLTRSADNGSIVLQVLNLENGQMTFYHRIEPSDRSGITTMFPIQVSKDLQTYVYSRLQSLSDLFIVTGWS